ncbi:hypothetical protein RF11_14745 [Thelohanellus kitauei]|uniref:Uncharacterized protein n=1 Tax=Thelohanellus kitauei TaxID=669202 RepID=A0A0C2JAR6_THEKT|nr:hypothetical protein RF11_14745 [Thelohanellus kitauei]
MDSLMICALHQPNKILFIVENAMFYFYNYFIVDMPDLAQKFWILCEQIYGLDPRKTYTLSQHKLTICLNQMTTAICKTKEEDCSRLLMIYLNMLHRQRFLDELKFNLDKFYTVTVLIVELHARKNSEYLLYLRFPKIWNIILNRSENVFKIDKIEKLIIFSTLFALDISSYLRKVSRGCSLFEVTQDKKKKLYIIYLALALFSRVDHFTYRWLRKVLTDLHESFQKYFEISPIECLTFETQFHILQYYIKSFVTLRVEISPFDDTVLNCFFERLVTYQSLNSSTIMITKFIFDLILALGDETYTEKIKADERLYLYEDLKRCHLSLIDDDFIKNMFFKCRWDVITRRNYFTNKEYDNSKCKIENTIMQMAVLAFNESNFFNEDEVTFYMSLFKVIDETSLQVPSTINPRLMSTPKSCQNSSQSKNLYLKPTFREIFRVFILIYEMKFIFGDMKLKFVDLNS